MDNTAQPAPRSPGKSLPVSPEDARHSLAVIEHLRSATSWHPNPWAQATLSALFLVVVCFWVGDYFFWGMGVLALMGAVGVLLRRYLFHPYRRLRPWQSVERGDNDVLKEWLLTNSLFLWPVAASALPAGPRWMVVLVGMIAAVHLSYALRTLGRRL